MSSQNLILQKASRRLMLSAWLAWTGRAALVVAGAGLAALLAAKASGLMGNNGLIPVFTVSAAALIATAVFGAVIAWLKRPTKDEVSALVDDRLGLQDRLSTNRFLGGGNSPRTPSAFEHVIEQQAETASQEAAHQMRDAFRIRFTRVWAWVPVAVVVLALTALILPNDFLGLGSKKTTKQLSAEAQQEIQQLQEIAFQTPPSTNPSQTADAADAEALINQVNELLRQPVETSEAEAAKQALLDEKAQQLEKMAQQMQSEQDRLQNQLSRLNSQVPDSPGAALEQALRNGDMAKAQQELESLMKKLENGDLSEAEKQALEQQMQQLAQQLSQDQNQSPNHQSNNNPSTNNRNMTQQQLQQLSQSMQKMGQCVNPQSSPNGQPKNPQPQNAQQANNNAKALKQASQQAQQSLKQLQQSQRNLQDLKQSQEASRNPDGQKSGGGNAPSIARSQEQNGGQEGTDHGQGIGGQVLGSQDNRLDPNNYQATGVRHDQDTTGGRQIVINDPYGPMLAGEATKQFQTVRRAQRESIERAVAEDRLPARYNKMRQAYFGTQDAGTPGSAGASDTTETSGDEAAAE